MSGANGNCFSESVKALGSETAAMVPDKNGGYTVIASDGMAYSFRLFSGDNTVSPIIVDVNGIKGPNRMGRDVFHFRFTRANGIKPYGFNLPHADIIKPGANPGCSIDGAWGYYCAALVLSEGQMKY